MLIITKENDEWKGGYKYFTEDEMRCKGNALGICDCFELPLHSHMLLLDTLRSFVGSLPVSSGSRCLVYNKYVGSSSDDHPSGKASDVLVSGLKAVKVFAYGYCLGFRRFGISQKGSVNERFIHLCSNKDTPALWSY